MIGEKMDHLYYNVMEEIIEEEYERQKENLDCCQCEECKYDIIAYTLNKVKPTYVATEKGALMVKLINLGQQQLLDIRKTIVHASIVVHETPKPEKHKLKLGNKKNKSTL